MTKISIVIPVYNAERYICRCLDSVINQQYHDYDIICVNDASTDGSLEILRSYERANDNLIVIDSMVNKGLSSSRNMGLQFSNADFVFFLDSDDFIIPGSIEKMVDAIEESESDILLFSSEVIYENDGIPFKTYEGKLKNKYVSCENGIEIANKLISNDDFKFSIWQHLYRRDFLVNNELLFGDGLEHEDLLFTFEAYSCAKKVKVIDNVLHKYVVHNDSVANDIERNIIRRMKSFVIIYQRISEYYLTNAKCDSRTFFVTYCLNCVRWNLRFYYSKSSYIQRMELENCWESAYDKHLFMSLIEGLGTESIDEKVLSELGGQCVYIFGAGKYAQKLIPYIERYNIAVLGIIETKKTRDTLFGYKIYELESISEELTNSRVIIARKPVCQQEMIDELKEINKSIVVVKVFR